jgi:putative nucleotidyltransferase with HDIG domain
MISMKNMKEYTIPRFLERLLAELLRYDSKTYYHSIRVALYAAAIAEELGLNESQRHTVFVGGLVHDVGKMMIPSTILLKPSRLDESEFMLMQTHPNAGLDVLSKRSIEVSREVLEIVACHHEKLNGHGYPRRLSGEQIPFHAKIVSVADAFDAMTGGRAYRDDQSVETAIGELNNCSGTHFDPLAVEAFLRTDYKKIGNIH